MAPEFVKVWSGTADGPAGRASVPRPVEPEPEPRPPKPRRLRPIPPKDTPAVRFAPPPRTYATIRTDTDTRDRLRSLAEAVDAPIGETLRRLARADRDTLLTILHGELTHDGKTPPLDCVKP